MHIEADFSELRDLALDKMGEFQELDVIESGAQMRAAIKAGGKLDSNGKGKSKAVDGDAEMD